MNFIKAKPDVMELEVTARNVQVLLNKKKRNLSVLYVESPFQRANIVRKSIKKIIRLKNILNYQRMALN